MPDIHTNALAYVRNTNGGATREHFITDWEPVGEQLWNDFLQRGWVEVRGDRIYLTNAGTQRLGES